MRPSTMPTLRSCSFSSIEYSPEYWSDNQSLLCSSTASVNTFSTPESGRQNFHSPCSTDVPGVWEGFQRARPRLVPNQNSPVESSANAYTRSDEISCPVPQ